MDPPILIAIPTHHHHSPSLSPELEEFEKKDVTAALTAQ
jgi:hypothetical protein